ncbi:Hypothetical protein CAP_5411 [Chondromyces apiculatus DSM 436]|uniref:Uncharacterized protein n=1 Tax=Chondromyces apiculatus DSM 436 TaxID=1192034 RepID=A0A017T488_9BACT|nr:Hypothetical protein CAP_5411 [Chondromyces apiculatus DSM 436]
MFIEVRSAARRCVIPGGGSAPAMERQGERGADEDHPR